MVWCEALWELEVWAFLLVLVHVRSAYVRLPGTVRHSLQGPVPGDAQLHKGLASGMEACLGNPKFHLLLWSKGIYGL